MKILLAAVAASAHMSGVSRHAVNLARCLLANADVSSVHLVVGEWQFESIKGVLPTEDVRLQIQKVSIGRSSLDRNLWFYGQLPILAAMLEADIVHLAYPVPLNRNAFHCPTVVTLHDLYPYDIPDNFGFPKVLFNRIILQQCLKSVDAISCVSDSTRRALAIHTSSATSEKAVTIYNCVEPAPNLAGPIPAWSGEPFLLCVAQHRRNKNVVLAIQVFRSLLLRGEISPQARLVVVGITGPETPRIRQFIRASGVQDRIVLLQGIDDAELQWCYGHCELLLAPSLIEGFGLPVVEGMFHGCRIVCSDIPAFREIGGSYCHYASLGPDAEQSFSDAARLALRRVRPGASATGLFSGVSVADASLQLYSNLYSGRSVRTEGGYPDFSIRKTSSMDAIVKTPKAHVLGIAIDAVNMDQALAKIAQQLQSHSKGYVCLCGVHGIMEAQRDRKVASAFAGASLVVPDGMPIVWVGRHQGNSEMERVAGPDLMLEVIRREQFRGYKHFLCGGKDGVAAELRDQLLSKYPWVQIVGIHTPPFGPMSSVEEEEFLATIRRLQPDIVWIGISTPKQERFMERYLPLLDTTLMFGVGAAFDFHTGRLSDCAEWIKLAGLQWFHRLLQDPKHLWKRCLRNNPAFIWHIALQLAGLRDYPPTPRLGSKVRRRERSSI